MSDEVVLLYTRADHMTAALSIRERFDANVNSFQVLTFITERSVLDDVGILDSP